MDVNALEQLLSELNDCELYARADELSEQFFRLVYLLNACLSISKPATLTILWISVEIQMIPALTLLRPF